MAIIQQFELRRRQVASRFEQPAVVKPINPFEGRVFNIVEFSPRTTAMNNFSLIQSDDGLGQRIIRRVADAADRRLDARLRQALRVSNREIF